MLWLGCLLVHSATAQSEVSIFVNGACGMCKDRIEEAAVQTTGVIAAEWDWQTRLLHLEVDPETFEEEQVHYAVTDIGHDTQLFSAADEVYDALPGCCLYRDYDPLPESNDLHGYIFELNKKGKSDALIGATVFWLGSETEGVVTDKHGSFRIPRNGLTEKLVVSYVGYQKDTIDMQGKPYVEIQMSDAVLLEGVEVSYRKKATEISFMKTLKVEEIGKEELLKAACCNLSESFETNPSVDVSFTDAVTGTRQIQMLGLAGPYVQITRENMPDIRGLSSIYGFTYTPGPWVESIQLAKGPGTVVNGFESMTGQINVELKKPEESERFYLNLYGNEGGRLEANTNFSINLGEDVSTGFLLHYSDRSFENDRNKDGFLDNPLGSNLIALNRWKFFGPNGWMGQIGIKGTIEEKQSGQLSGWQAAIDTRRLEGWAKVGRVIPKNINSSFGLQLSGMVHDQDGVFGNRTYDANQRSFYSNFIYKSILGTTFHEYKAGASFQYDEYSELVENSVYNRREAVPGVFAEYTYKPSDQLTIMAGLRGDYHNLFGFFLTPRAHFRYAFGTQSVLRASLGRGQRTANIFAENIGGFASNRQFLLQSDNSDLPYGLNPEVSWNGGLNFTQKIRISGKDLVASVDAYHTRFTQQVVVDYDQQAQSLYFYNLDGQSFSNSIQAQFDYELIERFDIRLAYRFNDVRTDYLKGQLEKPLIARHRAFINGSYATENGWQFDATLNWQGSKRLPGTESNPIDFQLEERSPSFFLLNGQISKTWKETFALYLGVENALNFVQKDPILSANDPISPFYDASIVWGPIFGRMIYTGLRYTLQ